MSPTSFRVVSDITFLRCPPVRRSAGETAEIERAWQVAVARNPALFDGPIVAVRSVEWKGESCLIRWSRARYSEYLWRYAEGVDGRWARVLYVSVALVTVEGALALARMATGTSEPGRLQLPGGNVDVPSGARDLTASDTCSNAVRELAEETGLVPPADAARLWLVKEGGAYGDIGVFYRIDGLRRDRVESGFTDHRARLLARGERPELAALVVAREHVLNHDVPNSYVDYVPALLEALGLPSSGPDARWPEENGSGTVAG